MLHLGRGLLDVVGLLEVPYAPVVPVQTEKLRIFRTIFWVSLREN